MREITRREFFKEAAFFTARVALPFSPFGRLFDFPHIQEDPLSALNFLKDLDPPPEHLRLPPNLRGIYVNIPFAWDKPNDISTLQMIDQAATLGTSNLRIIIDNRLIAPDGTYNKDVVRKIRRFSEHVRERTEQKVGLLVTLYDDNFGEFETKGRPDLFGSQTTKNAFKDRLRYLVSSLGDIPSITAWGVGNEIEVREHKPVNEQKTIHTDFFMEMITAIRQEDPTRWILTGTRRAYCIDDKPFAGKRVAMTDHQYPGFSSDGIDAQPIFDPNDAIEMKRYIQTMSTPLVIEEIGVNKNRTVLMPGSGTRPEEIQITVPDDRYLIDFFALALKAVTVSPLFARPKLYASSYGLWALGTEDGFDVAPATHPLLLRVLPTLNTFLKK